MQYQSAQSAPAGQPPSEQGGGRSAIPSYQEIYREMGLVSTQDPRRRQQQQQQQQQAAQQQHAGPRRPQHAPPSVAQQQQQQQQLQQQQAKPQLTGFAARKSNLPAAPVPRGYVGQGQALAGGQCRSSFHFGHLHRDVLEEGKELFKRENLFDVGGHLSETREVHGNAREGCDSLCISNLVRVRNPSSV